MRLFLAVLVTLALLRVDPVAAQAAEEADPAAATEPPEASSDPALTPEYAEALERFATARQRADAGDCSFAVAEFEEIYRLLEGHPRRANVFYNMGVCYETLFRYDQAITAYERYIEEAAPEAQELAEVQAQLRALARLLGTIVVASNVPATMWVGDREVGMAPGPLRVPAGQHTVELRAVGYEPARQSVTVAAGREEALTFELAELSDYEGVSPTWVWVSAGATLAAAIGGGVAGVIALSRKSDVDDVPIRVDEHRDEVRTPALAADILFGVAGAFAVATVILATTADWRGDDEGASAALRPVVGPHTAGLLLQGSF